MKQRKPKSLRALEVRTMFEPSRMTPALLAGAYECAAPIVRRDAGAAGVRLQPVPRRAKRRSPARGAQDPPNAREC